MLEEVSKGEDLSPVAIGHEMKGGVHLLQRSTSQGRQNVEGHQHIVDKKRSPTNGENHDHRNQHADHLLHHLSVISCMLQFGGTFQVAQFAVLSGVAVDCVISRQTRKMHFFVCLFIATLNKLGV